MTGEPKKRSEHEREPEPACFEDARAFVRNLSLNSRNDWLDN